MYCHPAAWGLGHPSATEQPAGRRSCEFGRLLKYGKWCSKLLFFEAITLCHVRELSRSDAQVARRDSWSRAWGSCGIVFSSSLR